MSKKVRAEYYHTWHDDNQTGTYFYRNYKLRYLTITRYMPGEKDPITNEIFNQITYIPHINGFRLHDRGGGVRSESIEYKFPTLEDAKIQTMKQVDKTIEFAKDVRYVRISKD